MTFRISPGVSVQETDLTAVIPAVSSSIGAFAGGFKWGPVEQAILVSREEDLVANFLPPDDDTRVDFLTAASFLAYSSALQVVRAYDTNAVTGALNATTGTEGVRVKNDAHYEDGGITYDASIELVARYPGEIGNTLQVIVVASAEAYDQLVTLSEDVGAGEYTNDLYSTLVNMIATKAPGTSVYAEDKGALNDEMHIFIVDKEGLFSGGVPGTILESYFGLSQASDATTVDGSPNYYKTVLNSNSKYVRWVDHFANFDATKVGTPAVDGLDYSYDQGSGTGTDDVIDVDFAFGSDGTSISESDYIAAYDEFANADTIDVSLIFMGKQTSVPTLHVIQNIAEVRKDCMVFASPPRAAVVNNANELNAVIEYRDAGLVDSLESDTLLGYSTSYAVLDNNWKYMLDKYNDVYAWVPLNGDIAGLCARTDSERDPWWSPGGFQRGNIKNVVKLAWNADESERDQLYQAEVNPVVSFPGRGTVLFGDKTLLARPSAFDRINVRRLFIILEKSIATAAQFQLFEFNDQFTRAQFVALVEPFLREVQGRRGVTDFRVVCDETNNTGQVIDSNSFVADIFIQPARSINFMRLNFVAVRTGVSFDEIAGGV